MKPIKINISAEVREFNEAVETCDLLTDYKFDQESAKRLIEVVKIDWELPEHALWLLRSEAAINVNRVDPLKALKAIVKLLDGSQPKDIPGALMVAKSAIKSIKR